MLIYQNEIAEILRLDGPWQFAFHEGAPWQEITVPGCWEQQGYPKTLEGPVHYRRAVDIPAHWKNQRVQLEFDAASYACSVECSGVAVGEHRGMWTPFAFDLTGIARPGKPCQLDVYVTKPGKRYPMRQTLAGFLPDLATTFGGLWQPVRLRALRAGLINVVIESDWDHASIHCACEAAVFDRTLDGLEWRVTVARAENIIQSDRRVVDPGDPLLDYHLQIDDIRPWSVEDPQLYSVCIGLYDDTGCLAQVTRQVGFRQVQANGSQLVMNGQPLLARGILSWGWDPERIAPYITLEEARREIRAVKEMGFNLIKMCLVLPNQEYFQAADQEGMLLWAEYPMWLPELTDDLRRFVPREYADITARLRGHASVGLYSLGCELNRTVDQGLLEKLDRTVRSRARDVLICDNSGSGESYGGLDSDLADFTDYHPYYDLYYFEPLLDHWRRDWQPSRPWIFGEFCDADTYRDVTALVETLGGQRPWWMTADNPISRWRAENQALLQQEQRLKLAAPGFAPQVIRDVSYAQAFVIRKYTLETLRRRAGMGGYVITGLRDTPISTSGLWDDLGQAKFATEEFLQINGSDLLCLDVDRRRVWCSGGDRPDPIDPWMQWSGSTARWRVIAHCSESELPEGGYLRWDLTAPNTTRHQWRKTPLTKAVPAGQPVEVGAIECRLPVVEQPVQLRLDVKLKSGERVVTNTWPVWVVPAMGQAPEHAALIDPLRLLDGIGGWIEQLPRWSSAAEAAAHGATDVVTPTWDADLRDFVHAGGRAVLLQQSAGPLPALRVPFWREAIKLFCEHPLWQFFPHQGFTDLQFFALGSDVAFHTSQLSKALAGAQIIPILRRLDARAFHISEYLFEAQIGMGRLFATTLRLQGGAGAQPSGPRRNIAGQVLLRALLSCS